MALPKKHGLRKLQVGPTGYYWKIRHERSGKMTILIGEVADPNCRLTVLTNWYDQVLLLAIDAVPLPSTGLISPGLVRKAIDYARQQGWGAAGKRNLVLHYQDEAFSVQPPFTNSI